MTYRLMIKTHLVTGLKYLCKTEREDYEKYLGSGKYWKLHLKVHGPFIKTEVLFETDSKAEFKKIALSKSTEFNVVESDEWANLIPENGEHGGHYVPHSEEYKIRMSEVHRNITEVTRMKMSRSQKSRPPVSIETKQKLSKAGQGRKVSEETKKSISLAKKNNPLTNKWRIGTKHSEETRRKIKEAWERRKASK